MKLIIVLILSMVLSSCMLFSRNASKKRGIDELEAEVHALQRSFSATHFEIDKLLLSTKKVQDVASSNKELLKALKTKKLNSY